MTSFLHEALVALFRNRPELAPVLLRDSLGVDMPAFTEARAETAEVEEVVPPEQRADLVVVLRNDRPVKAIVVDVHLDSDPVTRITGPGYVISARARYRCPTCLLVVTNDRWIESLCAAPSAVGLPGWLPCALLVGPNAVPILTKPEQSHAVPEMSVLSAMMHGSSKHGLAVAASALQAVRDLPAERTALYTDFIRRSLNETDRQTLDK